MKQTTKDLIKAITIISMASTTAILILAGAGNESELQTALAAFLGVITYVLAQKWINDERDQKSGITKAVNDELQYMKDHGIKQS